MKNSFALIVEDEQDISLLYEEILKLEGFTTQTVPSGEEALTLLDSLSPNLVVLDIRLLGEISGSDVLMRIRAQTRLEKTKVVVITAYAHLIEELQNYADLVLLKPFNVAQFRDLVIRLCSEDDTSDDAGYDTLTGLTNRENITECINWNLTKANKEFGYLFAVAQVELQNMRGLAIVQGEDAVDVLLIEAAQCLRTCLRPKDPLAHLGKGRFILVLENLKKPDNAFSVARRVQETFDKHFKQRYNTLPIHIGIAVLTQTHEIHNGEEALSRVSALVWEGNTTKQLNSPGNALRVGAV